MLQALPKLSTTQKIVLAASLVLVVFAAWWLYRLTQKPDPYKIGIIISRTEVSEQEWDVVENLVSKRLEEINENNGINGHPLQAIYLDDDGDSTKLVELIEETVKENKILAFIGAKSVWRAMAAGPIVTREQIPFIGDYVYTHLTDKFPTMYTSSLGVKEGTRVFEELLRAKATKVGFIGEQNAPHSQTFFQGVKNLEAKGLGFSLTYHKFFPKGHQFSSPELKAMADSIREKVDFLIFTNEVPSIYPVLEAMEKYQAQVPVYCGLIDIAQLDSSNPYFVAAELYDFNSLGIPGTHNSRLQQELELTPNSTYAQTLQEYQLGLAGSLADLIGLITEAATDNSLPPNTSIRKQINQGLQQYINGNKIYRGWMNDYYFTDERALGGTILVAWKPRNRSMPILAPRQFFFSDTSMQQTQVLYTSLDLARIDQVNDQEKTFLATFYLQIQSIEELDIKQVSFSNAARNTIDHEPLIDTRLIRTRTDTTGFGFHHYLYKVSGKFQYEPDLKNYPLDEQYFPISLQSNNALKHFLIQPSYAVNRDTIFESEGWSYKRQFVGFDQNRISASNTFTTNRKSIPLYKFSFVYVMKRTSIDYFLKTLMPLFTILTIAYFSVYIPPREFEAEAAMQVTALLSSIALYFSTFKPQIQYATASDKIFIFSYIMVTTLIGTTILIYIIHPKKNLLKKLAKIYQRLLFPLIIIGFSIYIRWF